MGRSDRRTRRTHGDRGRRGRVPLASDLILLKLAAGGILDLRDAAALLAIGDRDALIRDVERRLPEVRPDVTAAWRDVLAMEL